MTVCVLLPGESSPLVSLFEERSQLQHHVGGEALCEDK